MTIRISAAIAMAGALLWSGAATAASAVAINAERNQYSWHTAPTIDVAQDEALAACKKISGGECHLFSVCGLPGQASIAFNRTKGNWGAACGDKTKAAADAHAMETCNLRAQAGGTCEVVERFSDSFAGDAVARSYFRGNWAEQCGGDSWYNFRFINAREFRLQNCTAVGCKDSNKVFRPRDGETTFVWPTDNTRLTKRGPDQMRMSQINDVYLLKCAQ